MACEMLTRGREFIRVLQPLTQLPKAVEESLSMATHHRLEEGNYAYRKNRLGMITGVIIHLSIPSPWLKGEANPSY